MHCSSGPVVSSLLVQWSVVCCIHIRPCSIVNVIPAPSEEASARTVWSEALRLFRILKVAQNEAAEDWLTFNPLGGVAGPKARLLLVDFKCCQPIRGSSYSRSGGRLAGTTTISGRVSPAV